MSFHTSHLVDFSSSSPVCRQFTFSELEIATRNFDESLVIGRGGFGKVYRGTIHDPDRETVLDAAVKRLESGSNQGAIEFRAEVEMLSKLRHCHLVSLIGYCNDGQEMLLVYEYMPNGTLADSLHKDRPPLTWLRRLKICIGAARGLDYLHTGTGIKHGVIHRDVKTTNILLDHNWAAKISDFGLSKIGPTNQTLTYVNTSVKGTFGYMDPDYFQTGRLTRKSDVYAFGVILFEVLCKKQAVDSSIDEEQWGLATWAQESIKLGRLDQIVDSYIKGNVSQKCLKQFALLAERCLHSRPKQRPTMAEVVVSLESILSLQEKNDAELLMKLSKRRPPTTLFQPNWEYLVSSAKDLKIQSDSQETVNRDSEDDSLKDFWIPDYILLHESEVKQPSRLPSSPVIVFVNWRSGDQLGGELLISYQTLLNKNQVFDLNTNAPDKVLHKLYLNIEKLKYDGDSLAFEIQRRLRIIVAGGDGTASWILGVISDLKLAQPPPVATMPLGTGNNLSFAFGWGKENPGIDLESVKMFLNQVNYAKEMKVDSWHVLMRMKAPRDGDCDPIPPLDLPHSLHAVHRFSQFDESYEDGYHTFRGGFWNDFSMGFDAQVSYRFHTEKKLHPEKFQKQASNQSAYAKLTRSQGWFGASLSHPSSWNIGQLARVYIMRKPGYWEVLSIPPTIRSIICLNLPSFSGGQNPWGMPSTRRQLEREWTFPYVDDGFLEIVGFQNAWPGAGLYAPTRQRTRLAQARGVRFEFRKGPTDHTFMRMDGEPWKQPLPIEDDTVTIEISCLGQVSMLAIGSYPSKSVNDPSTPRMPTDSEWDSDDDELIEDMYEERRKFGAASSFRLPEDFDISHLS